jgi:hypothetical protein
MNCDVFLLRAFIINVKYVRCNDFIILNNVKVDILSEKYQTL